MLLFPVFLDGESKYFKRRDAEFFFFFRTRNARMERKFRLFCVFRVHVILTTDIQDLTDFHHERKRDNLFNLWSFL